MRIVQALFWFLLSILFISRVFVGIGLGDEGHDLSLSMETLRGEHAYSDFFTLYPPTIFFLLGGLFELFGQDLIVSRIFVALLKLSICFLSYCIARRLTGSNWALLAPFLIFFLEITDRFLLIAYSALVSELLLLAAWLCLLRFLEDGRRRWVFVMGCLCAAAFAFKQPPGVVGTMAFLVWLFDYSTAASDSRTAGWASLGLRVAILSGLVIPFVVTQRWSGLIWVLPAAAGLALLFPGRGGVRVPGPWRVLGLFATGWLLVFLPWMTLLFLYLGRETALRGVFFQPMMEASFRTEHVSALAFFLGALRIFIPLLAPLAAGMFIMSSEGIRRALGISERLAAQYAFGVLLGVFLVFTLYPWPMGTRALWIIAPSAVIASWLAAEISAYVHGRRLMTVPLQRGFLALSAVVLLAAIALGPWLWASRARSVVLESVDLLGGGGRLVPSGLERARIWIDATNELDSNLAGTARFIEAHTEPSDPLFVFPEGDILYFLSGRSVPIRYANFGQKRLSRQEETELVEELRARKLQVVVRVKDAGSQRFPQVDAMISEGFQLVETLGRFEIWMP